MKATEINLLPECVNQFAYGIKDNADLKSPFSFGLNPRLENSINKQGTLRFIAPV